jgi:hypothetical protein
VAPLVAEAYERDHRGLDAAPTLLIDGIELDGYPATADPACRIDLPTQPTNHCVITGGVGWPSDCSR